MTDWLNRSATTSSFSFHPDCLHGSWTCTELSEHWRSFLLVSCDRLSWSLSFWVCVKLFFRIVTYKCVSHGTSVSRESPVHIKSIHFRHLHADNHDHTVSYTYLSKASRDRPAHLQTVIYNTGNVYRLDPRQAIFTRDVKEPSLFGFGSVQFGSVRVIKMNLYCM